MGRVTGTAFAGTGEQGKRSADFFHHRCHVLIACSDSGPGSLRHFSGSNPWSVPLTRRKPMAA